MDADDEGEVAQRRRLGTKVLSDQRSNCGAGDLRAAECKNALGSFEGTQRRARSRRSRFAIMNKFHKPTQSHNAIERSKLNLISNVRATDRSFARICAHLRLRLRWRKPSNHTQSHGSYTRKLLYVQFDDRRGFFAIASFVASAQSKRQQ